MGCRHGRTRGKNQRHAGIYERGHFQPRRAVAGLRRGRNAPHPSRGRTGAPEHTPQHLGGGGTEGGGGVFRSTDNGESWVQVNNGLTTPNIIDALAINSNVGDQHPHVAQDPKQLNVL